MTYSKTIDNNFIFSVFAILLINLGHDCMRFIIHLFIRPLLPNRWDKWLDLHKKPSVHVSSKWAGCAFDEASLAAWSVLSFLLISLWLRIQPNVIFCRCWIFPDMSVKACLQEDSYSPWFQWPVIPTCYQKILQSFTYCTALSIASISTVKILKPSYSL